MKVKIPGQEIPACATPHAQSLGSSLSLQSCFLFFEFFNNESSLSPSSCLIKARNAFTINHEIILAHFEITYYYYLPRCAIINVA